MPAELFEGIDAPRLAERPLSNRELLMQFEVAIRDSPNTADSALASRLLRNLKVVADHGWGVELARSATIQAPPTPTITVRCEWLLRGFDLPNEFFRVLMCALRDGIRDTLDERAIHSFIDTAQGLHDEGKADPALDLIYDEIDRLLQRAESQRLAALLQLIDAERYATDILLALLTATLPVRGRLIGRDTFYQAVSNVLSDRGEDAAAMLTGLQ